MKGQAIAAIVGIIFVMVGVAGGFGIVPLSGASVQSFSCPGFYPAVCPNLEFHLDGRNLTGYVNGTYLQYVSINSLTFEVANPSQTSCFDTNPVESAFLASRCTVVQNIPIQPGSAQYTFSDRFNTVFSTSINGTYDLSVAVGYSVDSPECQLTHSAGCSGQFLGTTVESNVAIPSNASANGCGTGCPQLVADFSYTVSNLTVSVHDTSKAFHGAVIQVDNTTWNFGVAGAANGSSATHTYTKAGTYVVTETELAYYPLQGISPNSTIKFGSLVGSASYNVTVGTFIANTTSCAASTSGCGSQASGLNSPSSFILVPLSGFFAFAGVALLVSLVVPIIRGNPIYIAVVTVLSGIVGYAIGIVMTGRFF